ncbi:MAG TPA: putative porin, partial [Terriglobales bacterium]|nr:putative porin [Terriglobales bacterium]
LAVKSILRWMLVPALGATLFAQTAKPRAKKAPAKPAQPAVTAADVQALKDALAAQQLQIQQLQQSFAQRDQAVQAAQQAAQDAQAAAHAAQERIAQATGASADKETVAKLSSDLGDVKATVQHELVATQDEQKRVSLLEGTLSRFRWSGDIRVRGENFNQENLADRNRARIRVRFGFEGKLNEDFTGGVALATGTLGDPSTTNETLTNNFERKTIALDRGYITYNPVGAHWLSLTGGKFAFPWQRTSITFDPDINPEGFDEKLSFDTHRVPGIENFTIQAMQLLSNEVSGTGGLYHGHDSFAAGGQLSARLHAGIWTATPSFTILNWRYADALLNSSAFAVGATNAGVLGNPITGTTGVGPIPVPGEGRGCNNPSSGGVSLNVPTSVGCVFAPNGMTNATWVDFTNPTRPVWHFASQFLYADFILNNQFRTGIAKLPLNILGEYEDNLNAAAHPLDFTAKSGCTTTGTPPVTTCTTSEPAPNPTLGSQSHAYLVDVSLGQQKRKGDFQFGYAWERSEQDATIASFGESDQRAPTNVLQHRVYALWRLQNNTLASFTWWRGRTLNTALLNAGNGPTGLASSVKPGQTEPYLNRLQFDLIYTF